MRTFTLTKKVLLILMMVSLSVILKAQQQVEGWIEITTGIDTEDSFIGICCINENTVLVSSDNGLILKTTDGGESWESIFLNEGHAIRHIDFADENVGYAVANGYFIKTTDSGNTWNEIDGADDIFISSISSFDHEGKNADFVVLDAETFFLFDNNSVLWRTTDGGNTLQQNDLGLGDVFKCEMFF